MSFLQRLIKGQVSRGLLVAGSTEGIKGVVLLLTTAHVARMAGSHTFGVLGFAQGVLTYFLFLANLGLDMLGARLVARHPRDDEAKVGEVTFLKVCSSMLSFGVLLLMVWQMDRSPEVKHALFHFGLSVACVALTFDWYFYGRQHLGLLLVGRLTTQALLLTSVIVLVRDGTTAHRFPILFSLSNLAGAVYLLVAFARRAQGLRIWCGLTQAVALLKQALPLGLSLLLAQVLINFGIVALGFFSDERSVGQFTAAQKLTFGVLYQGGQLLNMGFYPVLSRLYGKDLAHFARVLRFYRLISLAIGLVVATFGLVSGRAIMHLVYTPAFESGVLPFRVLCVAVGLSFAEGPMNWAMMATRFEGRVFTRACLTATAMVVSCLILIPCYGALGAALATVVAAVIAVAVTWLNFRRSIREMARTPSELADAPGP